MPAIARWPNAIPRNYIYRDGLVPEGRKRPGITRPSHVYELTPEVEQLLSKAYIPVLTHLVAVFADA